MHTQSTYQTCKRSAPMPAVRLTEVAVVTGPVLASGTAAQWTAQVDLVRSSSAHYQMSVNGPELLLRRHESTQGGKVSNSSMLP